MDVILNKDSNHIKIGYSNNPEKRLKALQTGNSNNLEILHIMNGDIKFERLIHFKFKQYKIRNEWFEYHSNIQEFILFLDYPKHNLILTKFHLNTFFDLYSYSYESLYEIFKFGVHIKSYYDKELLDKYSEFFEEKIIHIGKCAIIYLIHNNNLLYNRILDEIHAYRVINEIYEPVFD